MKTRPGRLDRVRRPRVGTLGVGTVSRPAECTSECSLQGTASMARALPPHRGRGRDALSSDAWGGSTTSKTRHAPEANSVVPSVVAIVRDDDGRILLIHKTDNNLWALPGGGHEIGESIVDTVVREVKEETGYDVEVETITGTYTNPRHVMAYDDGEVRQQFSIAFRARLVGGEARTSSESSEVVWVRPEEIEALDMHPSMRMRIQHALEERDVPFLG